MRITAEGVIGFGPFGELGFDSLGNAVEERKVAIVEAQSTGELPDSFDGVQFGAIGRQEVQPELRELAQAPIQMQLGAMVLGVVADGQHAATGPTAGLSKNLEKRPESVAVEFSGFATKQERAVA